MPIFIIHLLLKFDIKINFENDTFSHGLLALWLCLHSGITPDWLFAIKFESFFWKHITDKEMLLDKMRCLCQKTKIAKSYLIYSISMGKIMVNVVIVGNSSDRCHFWGPNHLINTFSIFIHIINYQILYEISNEI